MAVGGNRGRFYLVDAKTGMLNWRLTNEGHLGVPTDLRFTPDRKYLISIASDMTMRVWDIQNKKPHAVFRFTSPIMIRNEWLVQRDTEKAKHVYHPEGRYDLPLRFAISPDGKTVVVPGNLDAKVDKFALDSGKVTQTIKINQPKANALEFSEDGKWLVVGGSIEKGLVEVWDLDKNQLVKSFGRHDSWISHIAISPDKKTILTGGVTDGFRVWDVASGKQKLSYFTKDDRRMPKVFVGTDGSVHTQKDSRSAGVAFLPDGKTFLIAPAWTFHKTEIYFHDTATGEPVDFRKRVAALPGKGVKAP
jgi:WD40 repeat protein